MNRLKGRVLGMDLDIACPLPEGEIKTQISEIFKDHHYKKGRRKKNATYLDVGANVGMASLYFKDWAKKIYAVEPSKQNFAALEENTKGWNIERINVAIGNDDAGENYMYGVDEGSPPQTLFPEKPVLSREPVEIIGMNTLFKKYKIEHVDVMKIDVEGSEYSIFPSEQFAKVADKIDFIIGEAHFVTGGFPETIPEMLKPLGYDVKFVQLKKPNYERTLKYTNFKTGKEKMYTVKFNTIFTAERKKK